MIRSGAAKRLAAQTLATVCAAIAVVSCNAAPDSPLGPDSSANPPVCGFWYAIGDSPTHAEIASVGTRYKVVVLNAWEAAKMRMLRAVNPDVTVLVYKDLSSTRSYPGAVDSATDAPLLPTGVGYVEAESANPEWFARTERGDRIEWSRSYPGHWQMTVWDSGYQQAWIDNVTAEVIREGWDGVLADNDLATLRYYSDKLLAGNSTPAETDQRLRDGLDVLVTKAGERLNAVGKLFVPNVSESRLYPGRWTAHSRFGGAMEENFAIRPDPAGPVIPMDSPQWDELLKQSEVGSGWQLLVTQGRVDEELRRGFAAAALLGRDKTCWMAAPNPTYTEPFWLSWQDLPLGSAVGRPIHEKDGIWHRKFSDGWVAVNPTVSPATSSTPESSRDGSGEPASDFELSPGGSIVLVRPGASQTNTPGR